MISFSETSKPAPVESKNGSGTSALVVAGVLISMLCSIVSVGLVAFVLLKQPVAPGPGPGPAPDEFVIVEDVEGVAFNAGKLFNQYRAELSEEMAKAIESGKVQNSTQYAARLAEYQDAIERKAYQEVLKLKNKYIQEKDGRWTEEQRKTIVEFQRRLGKGYQKLVK